MIERQAGHVRADTEQCGLVRRRARPGRRAAAVSCALRRPVDMPRCMSSASAASRPSDQAGPISVTPVGRPLLSNPAGTAMAARSHRLTKLVKVPSRLFTPIGSAALQRASGRTEPSAATGRRNRGTEAGRCAARFGEAVKCIEGIDGAACQSALQDGARDRMQDVRASLHQVPQRGSAFGDPWPVVEQAGNLQEQRDVRPSRSVAIRAAPAALRRDADARTAPHANRDPQRHTPQSSAALPAPRPRLARISRWCRASGMLAPHRAWKHCPAWASARRCCRRLPGRGPTRRCRCRVRKARFRRRPRRPNRRKSRPARTRRLKTLRGMPYGLRVPTRPVAN